MKKSVIIVEDHKGLREQLVKIVASAADMTCIAAFPSAEEALPGIFEKQPDVILMDIRLPGMSGIQCVAEIKKTFPNMQIIMVTVYEDNERIFQALKAGASGYLVKSSISGDLLGAIRDIYNGGSPMSSPIARKVIQHFHLCGRSNQEAENLSPREREALELLASGFIYKEIGNKMNIDAETVRSYIKKIRRKMHVHSTLEAIVKSRL